MHIDDINLNDYSFPGDKSDTNSELIVEALRQMIESANAESRAQHKRFLVETWLSIASIAVASVAAAASLYSLYLVLTSG